MNTPNPAPMSTATAPTLPTTEAVNPRTEQLDRLSTSEMMTLMNDEDATVTVAVRLALPQIAQAVDAVANALQNGGRLIYIGAGTSGRIGCLDAAECLPTFGVSAEQVFGIIAGGETALLHAAEGAEDNAPAGAGAMDDAKVSGKDVVVGVSASGGAPYVQAALVRAKQRGATTVGVANSPASPLARFADILIEVVTGPEVITGSTRLKAGTAQKMVLNMITTGAMVKIGKTYGNRMVDVQATNDKLVARSRRLLREIGQVTSDIEADMLLNMAKGSVKAAIVMARRNVDASGANQLLREANGFLSRVIDIQENSLEGD